MDEIAPRLTLDSYRRLVRDLPAPSGAQAEAFCNYVATAHSWYKRLSPLPPGGLFVFFLDPAAGCDRSPEPDGYWTTMTREGRGFHYSAIATVSYREQYGHLAFASHQATRAGSLGPGPVRVETGLGATVVGADGRLWRVPIEIEAEAVALTGLIHPYGNQPGIWRILMQDEFAKGTWPEESGGDAAFARIQARCRDILADRDRVVRDEPVDWSKDRGVDAVFADLVEPERQRQRRLMRTAVERLVAMLDLRPLH